jgi:hypothetical protein
MAVIIHELEVQIQAPESAISFSEYGINAEENLQKMMTEMEVAEERRKRLEVD